jgi:hypothetical protein
MIITPESLSPDNRDQLPVYLNALAVMLFAIMQNDLAKRRHGDHLITLKEFNEIEKEYGKLNSFTVALHRLIFTAASPITPQEENCVSLCQPFFMRVALSR